MKRQHAHDCADPEDCEREAETLEERFKAEARNPPGPAELREILARMHAAIDRAETAMIEAGELIIAAFPGGWNAGGDAAKFAGSAIFDAVASLGAAELTGFALAKSEGAVDAAERDARETAKRKGASVRFALLAERAETERNARLAATLPPVADILRRVMGGGETARGRHRRTPGFVTGLRDGDPIPEC